MEKDDRLLLNDLVIPPRKKEPPPARKILRDAKGHYLKGQTGNPLGMRVGTPSFVHSLIERLKRRPREVSEIVSAVIKLAKMGDMRAMELLWERIDGKVIEKHVIEGEMPIQILFVPAQRLIEGRPIEIETKPVPQLVEGKNGLGE